MKRNKDGDHFKHDSTCEICEKEYSTDNENETMCDDCKEGEAALVGLLGAICKHVDEVKDE